MAPRSCLSMGTTGKKQRLFLSSSLVCILASIATAQNSTSCATPQWPDIRSVPQDLFTPPMLTDGTPPTPGKRVKQTTPSYAAAGSSMYHALYLPTDWTTSNTSTTTTAPPPSSPTPTRFPILVEFAGNGPWESPYGDYSCGLPDCNNMGYGLSAGQGFLWIGMPFGDVNGTYDESYWWGCPRKDNTTGGCPGMYNATPTLDYLTQTIEYVASTFNGDPSLVILMGWSRGALATNYFGLYDDQVSSLFAGYMPYSHFDGRPSDQWVPYPNHDEAAAISRLKRLNGRPMFVTEEKNGTAYTQQFLDSIPPGSGIDMSTITLANTGFCNHNDAWLLRPSATRTAMREWLQAVVGGGAGGVGGNRNGH